MATLYIEFICIILLTIIIAKWIGPWISNLIHPVFFRITKKIDYALIGRKEAKWESTVKKIIASSRDELQPTVCKILKRYAQVLDKDESIDKAYRYNSSVFNYFKIYSTLSFNASSCFLDASIRRPVTNNKETYIVIGATDDDNRFYAVREGDCPVIFLIELDDRGRLMYLEEDSPSFEHFIMLQYEMYIQED